MKKVFLILFLPALFLSATVLRADSAPDEEHVVLYSMKEDPTLAPFLGIPAFRGFYVLEIDEYHETVGFYHKIGSEIFRDELDYKLKDDHLILKNRKKVKTFIRTKLPADQGGREVIYPSDCPPERAGWRHGVSMGRRTIRRHDDDALAAFVNFTQLEYDAQRERCRLSPEFCGSPGCPEWEVAESSDDIASSRRLAQPAPSATPLPRLGAVLVEAKKPESEILNVYRDDIDTILPPTLTPPAVVVSTSVQISTLPFHGYTDVQIERQGLRIGTIMKRYQLQDKISFVSISIEPLLEAYQSSHANKCGTWAYDPNQSLFDVRGQPANFTQSPDGSTLTVCGKTVSYFLQGTPNITREMMQSFLNNLPFDDVERLVGSPK